MVPWEKRVLLKHYLEQGMSVSALAVQLGIGRRTIHRWIREGQLDRDVDAGEVRYTARAPAPQKLDPYKPILLSRLEAYPELTATRLFAGVKAAGYAGGYDAVKVFVRHHRPRTPAEPIVRFETDPGRQAQVDFARFQLPWGVRYALVVVLSYSRLLWLRFFARQDMRTLFQGLEQALQSFGGVPRELLFDQMRSVITRDLRMEGGRLVENAEFLRFSAHWGFTARACRPYRAKTKGKVERPIRYVRESFFYARDFVGDEDLNAQVEHWLETVANRRVHGTTLQMPLERFEREERSALQPLAERPYHSLVLLPGRRAEAPMRGVLPKIAVERRSLSAYAALAGGGL